jgi:hypothetical protein
MQAMLDGLHDRMTECEYTESLRTFENNARPAGVTEIPVMKVRVIRRAGVASGRAAPVGFGPHRPCAFV